jgi:hypothetical protein
MIENITQNEEGPLPAMLLGKGGEKLEFAMRQDCGGLMLLMLALRTAPNIHTAPAEH